MTEFNFLTRRRFLWTASAAAGAVTLKGCTLTPPSPSDLSPKAQTLSLSPAELPETTRIKLGYIAIVESAPLIIAQEKGFFARHGMTDVSIAKQPSWGAARDNAELGSENGGIDGGQWQMPMPHLLSEGLITKGNRKIPMVVLAQLCTHGNGVAVANKHIGKGFELNLAQSGAADYIREMKKTGTPFKAAYTFPKVNQDFWIRYWMAANGVDPNNDINLMAVPSSQTVANMKTGTMDAFSTGDPWPYRIVRDKVGFLAVLTAQIWQYHPEEYVAVRKEWIEKNPKATKAVLKAIMDAQMWCDKPENKEELSRILAQRRFFNVPPDFLRGPYAGQYQLGDTQKPENNPELAVKYWKDGKGSVSYPYKSHDLWFLTESVRWGYLPQGALSEADRIVNEVNGEKFWREAAQEMGVAQADIPQQQTRGVEKFFDGAEFDPAKPQAYLDSLKFKSLKA
ncbi:MAG: ABC transporter substrate-binding protein [Plectolyngbya sp. WJT66-NPBG17]|jgi:bicarbonate transport system substrate-binding protein|nr:ABC transporter substrate-binding protein [Plectolyngbya sp. WJT66-NPBG17]